jgi:hypothetical protein
MMPENRSFDFAEWGDRPQPEYAGALTVTQRLHNLLAEQHDALSVGGVSEYGRGYLAGLRFAQAQLLVLDPDADPGEHVPGRVYSAEGGS